MLFFLNLSQRHFIPEAQGGWVKSYTRPWPGVKCPAGPIGFNPRPDGSLDFPPPDGVGVWTPPPPPGLFRLLRIVEQNEKRRSKAREK